MTTTRTAPAQAPGRAATTELRRADGTAPRVLVVDDEPTLTDLLSMALRYEGWDVRTADRRPERRSPARDFRPDVVVLDVMLPDLSGLEVLHRMRADATDVPVLFLTAKDATRTGSRA